MKRLRNIIFNVFAPMLFVGGCTASGPTYTYTVISGVNSQAKPSEKPWRVVPGTQPDPTRDSSTAHATHASARPAIPVVYANNHGSPFKDFPAEEVARILAKAEEMTPPNKNIWFVLIRAGTWFPAGEVYFTPDKTDGRLRTGEFRIIWNKDAERMVSRHDWGKRYVQVVAPDAADEKAPSVPATKWLPFHTVDARIEDKQIVPLVDKMQQVRPAAGTLSLDDDVPISAITRENDQFRVEVAWPDEGHEDYFMFKAGEKGFEFVLANTVYH